MIHSLGILAAGVKSHDSTAFPIAALLVLLSVPICRRVAKTEKDPGLYNLLLWAAITHIIFAYINIWVIAHVYHGVTDTNRYVNQGAILARRFDHFDFDTGGINPPVNILGQGSVSIAAGVVMAIVGVNKLALFFVFAWLAWLATVGFYKAFTVTFPEGSKRRYAWMVFFLPSLLFWTSGPDKECMMYLSMGMMAMGAARVIQHKPGGGVLLVIGTVIGIYVRPQELLLFMAAFVIASVFRRRAADRRLHGLRRIGMMGLQAALLIATLSLAQELGKHAPVFNLTQLAQNNRGQASSLHYEPGPAHYLRDVYVVIFDPLPWNAHGNTQRLAAFENFVILVLVLTSFRRLRRLPRAVFVRPYVMMCVIYSIAFPYAFAALNNLGLIDRERVLLLPFLVVPLAIPVSPKGTPPRYPWEYSEGKRKRKARQKRWGAPVAAR